MDRAWTLFVDGFGETDIFIGSQFNSELSSSFFGNSYVHPRGNVADKLVLAGSYQFQLSEIEAYKKRIEFSSREIIFL